MDRRQAGIATSILIPLDGADPASRAIDFAATIGGPDATYTLLHVLPEKSLARDAGIFATDQIAAQADAAAALRSGGERLSASLPMARQAWVLRSGDPARTIVKEAKASGAGLIVMASRGRESTDEASFGSTADRIVRTSGVPVLVMRGRADDILGPAIHRMVVPLDGSLRAEQAIPVAGRLARRLGIPVKLVTVVDPKRSFPPTLSYAAAQTGAYFKEVLTGMQRELACRQDRAIAALRRAGVEVDAVLLYGPTVPSIVEETEAGDLLVMTSHGQGTERRWLLGSVSEELLREARLPIVLLRSRPEPDGVVLTVDESFGLQPMVATYR
jgi:nucleotide-binding universal stress UspA family protein